MHAPANLAAETLSARFGPPPDLAVILGSGAGRVTSLLESGEGAASYAEIGLPPTGVVGHRGEVTVGRLGRNRVALFAGRVHAYEGRAMEELARSVRAMAAWGVPRLLLTSAVGAVRADLPPGALVRLTDHINLMGTNPLVGRPDAWPGPRFPDLSLVYNPDLGQRLEAAASKVGLALHTGIYAAMLGPGYETPAEIRMLRLIGADVVGMSVVPEAVAAVHAGLPLAAISIVSNAAAGLTNQPLSHEEVTTVVGQAVGGLGDLLKALVLD